MGTGAALVLSQILIPTITANLSGIARQTRGKGEKPPVRWSRRHLLESCKHKGKTPEVTRVGGLLLLWSVICNASLKI